MKNIFFIFFIFGVITRLFPLLLLPVITRIGGEEQVADFMLFVSTSSFFCMFYLFGTQFELTRVFWGERKRLKYTVINSCFIMLSFGTVGSLFLFLFKFDEVYLLGSINGLITALVSYLLVYYRISKLALKFGIVDLFRVAVQYCFAFILISFYEFDLSLIIVVNIIWASLLFGWEMFRNRWIVSIDIFLIDRVSIRESIYKGIGVFPHFISIYGLLLFDKILLKELATDSVLAQYSVGFVVGQAVILVTDSLNKVWGPYAVKNIENGQKKDVVKKGIFISICAICVSPIVGICVYLFSGYYFPGGYELARQVAVVVSLVYVFQVIYFIIFPFLVQANAVSRIGIVSSISACVGAIVMFFLAYFGLYQIMPLGLLIAFGGQVLGIFIVLKKLTHAD